MSVPLRKEEPEFEDHEHDLTNADPAQSKRPARTASGEFAKDVENRPENVRTDLRHDLLNADARDEKARPDTLGAPGGGSASDATPLFPNDELEDLRTRWSNVQTAFVDEPRSAVQQADGLVDSALKRLVEGFAEERSKLEQQWDRGDEVSTEDLRIALQRYRSFFHRLLAV